MQALFRLFCALPLLALACAGAERHDCPAWLPVSEWPAPRVMGSVTRDLIIDDCHIGRGVRLGFEANGGSVEYVFPAPQPTVLDISLNSDCQQATIMAGATNLIPRGSSHFGGLYGGPQVPVKILSPPSGAPCTVTLQIYRTVPQ